MAFKNIITFLLCVLTSVINGQSASRTLLFIGTYTGGLADSGIYIYDFNSKTGQLKRKSVFENIINPSFLALSHNGQFLYACTESKLPANGKIAAFKVDSVNAKISLVNKQNSEGQNPVYVSADKTDRFVVNTNYTEGNMSVYPVNSEGGIGAAIQTVQFSGSSINSSRQEKAHVHAAVFSLENNFVFFPDLGSDKIRAFKFKPDTLQALVPDERLNVNTVAGSGPRHLEFHPDSKYVYCIEELSGMISCYTYKDGKWESIQRIFSYSKKQDSYEGSDIHISPDGLFLYASNRGESENTLSIFSIDLWSGKLKLVGHQSTYGSHPRNFVIDPSGEFLLVANLASDQICVFKRNKKTGLLTKTKYEITVPRPSCLKMRVYRD